LFKESTCKGEVVAVLIQAACHEDVSLAYLSNMQWRHGEWRHSSIHS